MNDDIRNYTAEELAQYDDAFESTLVEERDDYAPIPDGKFQVNIEKAEMARTKGGNQPMLKLTLKVLTPQYKNRLLWKHYVIKQDNLKWLKQDLATCGLTLDRLSVLPHNLERLIGIKLDVQKKTSGEFENIYLNRKLELTTEGGGYVGSDDIPF